MVDQNLQEACRVCNMTLLSIHNSEEQRFVHETLTHKSKSNLVHWNPIGPKKIYDIQLHRHQNFQILQLSPHFKSLKKSA